MLTLAQIAAIISLLLAFNVPKPTVDTVQGILNAKVASSTTKAPFTSTATVVFTPVDTNPTAPSFGATIQPMPDASADKSDILVETVSVLKDERTLTYYPLGVWNFKVKVLDKDGNTTPVPPGERPFQSVTMQSPLNVITGLTTENRFIDYHEGTEFSHIFGYTPSQKGEQTLTFTSGSLSKTISINVQ